MRGFTTLRCGGGACVFLCAFFAQAIAISSAFGQGVSAQGAAGAKQPLLVEISPEGVRALAGVNQPFLLLDASESGRAKDSPSAQTRRIYYTNGPSFRAAQAAVMRDRNASASAAAINETGVPGSQRLTGTPLDWRRAGLQFIGDPFPSRPLQLTPRQLSEALKDGADLQVIDLRPMPLGAGSGANDAQAAPFVEQALRLMPHEVDSELPKLSKQRWIVLVDAGGQVAVPIAESMYQRGFSLVTVLQGGWPAWVAATDR
jgi:rhodanese-related sulfurtransferase